MGVKKKRLVYSERDLACIWGILGRISHGGGLIPDIDDASFLEFSAAAFVVVAIVHAEFGLGGCIEELAVSCLLGGWSWKAGR
jgi:hypothetical protein